MPELPEVETIKKGLVSKLINTQIEELKIIYPKIIITSLGEFKKLVQGQTVAGLKRHGKYLFIILANSFSMVIHLRMTGQLFFVSRDKDPDKHTHLEFYLNLCKDKLVYRDIRKFGRFELIKESDIEDYINTKKLAPDALAINFNTFCENIKNKKTSIKNALLRQDVVAGLGNIYVDEILFSSRINPKTIACQTSLFQIEQIFNNMKKILIEAIKYKGTTFSDYLNTDGKTGQFQNKLKVYNRKGKPCSQCGQLINKEKVAGRGTYFCPGCQVYA
jgi:formamidopyrimidine-DNA glycosylase